MKGLVALGLTLAVAFVAPNTAAAGSADEAAAFFAAGEAAFARGEYRAAALAFDEAFKRTPHGVTAYNAALAWERAHGLERAADAFDVAATSGDVPRARAAEAAAKLAALERTLGRVEVVGPANARVTLAHVEGRAPPFRIHLEPGVHPVRVRFGEGSVVESKVTARAGERTELTLDEPPAPPRPSPISVFPPSAPPRTMTTTRKLGFVLVGAAAVSAGAAAAFGIVGLSARDEFRDGGSRDVEAHDRAVTFRTLANVGWVAAGSFALGGAVLLLFFPGTTTQTAAGLPAFAF